MRIAVGRGGEERKQVARKRTHGRGTNPHVPIDALRGFLRRPIIDYRELSADVAPNLLDFAEHAAAGKPYRLAEARLAALLRACLEDDAVCVHRVYNLPPLVHGERERLFAVDVLARAGGEHRNNRMPVVGGYDEHGVNRLVGEQVSEILVGFDRHRLSALFVERLYSVFVERQPLVVNVANRRNAYGLVVEQPRYVPAHHFAETDKPQIDFVVGRAVRKKSVRDKERSGGGKTRIFQECASFHN